MSQRFIVRQFLYSWKNARSCHCFKRVSIISSTAIVPSRKFKIFLAFFIVFFKLVRCFNKSHEIYYQMIGTSIYNLRKDFFKWFPFLSNFALELFSVRLNASINSWMFLSTLKNCRKMPNWSLWYDTLAINLVEFRVFLANI